MSLVSHRSSLAKTCGSNSANMFTKLLSYAELLPMFPANPRLFVLKLARVVQSRALSRFLKGSAQKEICGIRFDFDFELHPYVKEMYFENYKVEVAECIKETLRKGDVFVDVGANIGYMSAVGAGCVGRDGEVHTFEPVPEYFQKLKELADRNLGYAICANQCGLADQKGVLKICTNTQNIGGSTMVPSLMNNNERGYYLEVPVRRLDQYLFEKSIYRIALIKIDAEGFEFPVLRGLGLFFESTGERPPILCEIVPPAYPLLGSSLKQFSDYMGNWSYEAFSLIDTKKPIDVTKLKEQTNVLFRASRKGQFGC
jgi:FkbM family methyltransferase